MAVFYHISTDLKKDLHFTPRVPLHRHKGAEDEVIPRVCVAPSIADCLTSIPGGCHSLDVTNLETRGYYKVFRIDTEKLGISEEFIVNATTLFEKDLVRDADITNEHWITTPFSVDDVFFIRLHEWDEDVEDIIPHSIYQLAEEEYGGDYLLAHEEKIGIVPSTIKIETPYYFHEEVKKGEKVHLYIEDTSEFDAVANFAKEHFPIKILNEKRDPTFCYDYRCEVELLIEEDTNLKDLFLYHFSIINL